MKQKPRTFTFRVTVRLKKNPTEAFGPDDWSAAGAVNKTNMRNYIKDSVTSWSGQMPPDYPLNWRNMRVSVVELKE
jgi:hypothetical protein